jgi:hypothetical protein
MVGQLFALVALNHLNASDPYNFRTPIYTQWAMVGLARLIFLVIPESPWWLVRKEYYKKAGEVLHLYNGHTKGYNTNE